MVSEVILERKDLTYLKWSHIRNSSGTAGTFLKSESEIGGVKKYYTSMAPKGQSRTSSCGDAAFS